MTDIPDAYDLLLRGLYRAAGARAVRVPVGRRDTASVLALRGYGSLPPLVLVHGFSATGPTQYWPLTLRLRRHFRSIVLPDLPGHGASSLPEGGLDGEVMVEALCAVLDRVLDAPAIMFASSMSGGVAVHCALRRPEALSGLMLCSPGGAPFSPDEAHAFLRTFRIRSHQDALAFVDRLFMARHPLRHVYAFGVRRQFNRPHLVELLDGLPHARFLEPDELARVAAPVHLLWGRGDDLFPPSHVGFFRDNLPPGTIVDTPDHLGHAPFLHQADEVAERLLAFARRIDRTATRSQGDRPAARPPRQRVG